MEQQGAALLRVTNDLEHSKAEAGTVSPEGTVSPDGQTRLTDSPARLFDSPDASKQVADLSRELSEAKDKFKHWTKKMVKEFERLKEASNADRFEAETAHNDLQLMRESAQSQYLTAEAAAAADRAT